jgi:hypothetical protein
MSEALRIEVQGLRDTLGRFARDSDEGLRARQDAMLHQIAQQTKERLAAAAPRSSGPGPHLADMFALEPLHRDGASATIAIDNPKTVQSKAGRQWSLLRLLSGGTLPHDIPGAFGYSLPFGIGGRFAGHFHPGTHANPFVQQTVEQIDPRAAVMRTARGVVADLAGRAP